MHQNKMVRIALFFVLVNFSGRNCVTEADGSGISDDFRYDSTPSDFSGRNPVSFCLVQKRWLMLKQVQTNQKNWGLWLRVWKWEMVKP